MIVYDKNGQPYEADLVDGDEYRRVLEKLAYVRSLGEVYREPPEWNCAKMGGRPDFEDCEKINLSEL